MSNNVLVLPKFIEKNLNWFMFMYYKKHLIEETVDKLFTSIS